MSSRARAVARWTLLGVGLAVPIAVLWPGGPVGYLARQGWELGRVMAAREPIERVLERELEPGWREKLELVADVREYATHQLGLPADDLYRTVSLADVGPIHNVTAARADALEPVTWWFPIVGSVAYRGFYDRGRADALAADLRSRGFDVHDYPVSAFSTLGWFSDPIRPSMLRGSLADVAELVIHEAAHRVLYLPGHTDFNESFAQFVGVAGANAFLGETFGPDHPESVHASGSRTDALAFETLTSELVAALGDLYGSGRPRAELLERREAVFAAAQEEYRRRRWRTDVFSRFAERPLDNARLLSYRRYGRSQDAFERLLARCGDDLPATIVTIAAEVRGDSGRDPFTQIARLAALPPGECATVGRGAPP